MVQPSSTKFDYEIEAKESSVQERNELSNDTDMGGNRVEEEVPKQSVANSARP